MTEKQCCKGTTSKRQDVDRCVNAGKKCVNAGVLWINAKEKREERRK
jgi:hypothetical protein